MAELTISINSRPFAIECADGEEQRVSRLAEDLAARLGEVKKNVSGAGDSHLLVLVGLMQPGAVASAWRAVGMLAYV